MNKTIFTKSVIISLFLILGISCWASTSEVTRIVENQNEIELWGGFKFGMVQDEVKKEIYLKKLSISHIDKKHNYFSVYDKVLGHSAKIKYLFSEDSQKLCGIIVSVKSLDCYGDLKKILLEKYGIPSVEHRILQNYSTWNLHKINSDEAVIRINLFEKENQTLIFFLDLQYFPNEDLK